MKDSVPINLSNQETPDHPLSEKWVRLKLLVFLYILFLLVVSDVFVFSVISQFGEKTVSGRTPTTWGVMIQGVFLVIFYIIAIYLVEKKVL